MTGSVFHAVAPVSAVCAAFTTQPSAYPLGAEKARVAPPCASVAEAASAAQERLRATLAAAAARQEKAKVSCAHLGRHICPQCGQFGTFGQGLLRGQKQPCWGRKRR